MIDKIRSGVLGFVVGDAIGVPVEFHTRHSLELNPVRNMRGYGTWNQPAGTWSDDSSMMLCTLDSLSKGYDLYDIADHFVKWYRYAEWTPRGSVFDIGLTTKSALDRFISKRGKVTKAGMRDEKSNGNGSLMRILPMVYYTCEIPRKKRWSMIADVSSITHAHIRSILGCIIYVEFLLNLLSGQSIMDAYFNMKELIIRHLGREPEMKYYSGALTDLDQRSPDSINSSGYVVHTLEASLWCLLSSENYCDAVLRAVNLGGDTDTIAALTGAAAGIYYGQSAIPEDWLNEISRYKDIEDSTYRFYSSLCR